MSFRVFKSTTVLGLATQTPASSIARTTSSTHRSLIPVPVRSKNALSSTPAIPAKSSIRSRNAAPCIATTTASASAPKKTETSILKHVERLQKCRAAQANFQKATAVSILSKPKAIASRSTQSRPAMHPAPRVPSTVSNSSSSVARNERSVDAHVQRIMLAREKRTPASSPRSTPASSRKVTPIQPLQITKTTAPVVDLGLVGERLSGLTLASSAPVLKSCLKTAASVKLKHVSFVNYGGWNIHHLRAFTQDSPPVSFIPLEQAMLLQPGPHVEEDGRARGADRPSRTAGLVHPGSYALVAGDREIRWPPPDYDFPPEHRELPPVACKACVELANRGGHATRYHCNPRSVMCVDCLSNPGRRITFLPPIDCDGEEDSLDVCPDEHNGHDCRYQKSALHATIRWLYANYSERYAGLDDLLNG